MSTLYERTSVVITTNLSFSEWATRLEEPGNELDALNEDEALMGEGRPLPGTHVAELIDLLDADDEE